MKKFDVAVLGSTGFTGRLVCKHIVQQYHGKGNFTWAMAGRNRAKMEEMRTWLAEDGKSLADVDMIEADVADQASIDKLAAESSVVITAVGPYALYGRPVVKACVENKAHYCDITGEVQFILNTRDEFDDAAKAAGVRIVHSCGFDSVPSEVITLQAAHYMMTNYGKKLGEVTGKLMDADPNGGVGGGTIESGVNMVRQNIVEGDTATKRAFSSPYSLVPNIDKPEVAKGLPDKGGSSLPVYSPAAQAWGGPFVMAACNERVVRMSNALTGWKLGKQMVYSERYGTTFSEAFISSLIGAVFPIVLYLAARFEWVRQKLPAPGEGPDNVLDKSYFSFAAWALPEGGSEGGVRLKSTFADRNRSGGYWSTSRMLLESALCIIPENEKLLEADPYACPAGVLAPSSAFGLVLHDRLKAADFELTVEDAQLAVEDSVQKVA